MRPLSPHALRHSFVSVAASRGADVAAVSEHVGHASKAFAWARYRHVFPEERQRLTLDFTAPKQAAGQGDK